MIRVFNFSGGKTSAYMVIRYYQPGDLVIFCDTGREHPKTYKFINDFEAYENIPIIRLQYEGGFEEMLRKKGNKTLPNRMRRFCTHILKIQTARKYLLQNNIKKYDNYIGFRYDEGQRVHRHKEKLKSVTTKFPLYDDKIDKNIIEHYWKNKNYTLELPRILGNCTLCFMKGKNAIISILKYYPELAEPWINDEEKNNKKGHTYLPGVTIRQLKSIAQNNLFTNHLEDLSPAFDCACTT
jgi:hypothetical protein